MNDVVVNGALGEKVIQNEVVEEVAEVEEVVAAEAVEVEVASFEMNRHLTLCFGLT